jgi:hypothetical protein
MRRSDMRHVILIVVGLILLATVASTQARLGTSADEAAIKKLADTRQAAVDNPPTSRFATPRSRFQAEQTAWSPRITSPTSM